MRIGWRSALGILLSAALLWYAFHGISWGEVGGEIRQSNVLLLALSSIAATGIFPLRARRWRTILDPIQPGLPFGTLWRATAIGMMVNNVIPARAGELARAYALSRETESVPFSAALASLAVDRVFDALVILLLMLVAMLDPRFPKAATVGTHSVGNYAGGGILFVAAVFAVLYLIVFFPGRLIELFELFARRVAPAIEARGREVLLAFSAGLSVLRSPLRFAAVLWWTLLHWLLNALAFWIAFRAVGIAAPFTAALFLQGIIAFGVAIPQAPGFFGLFETLARVGLGVFGIGAASAVTWAIAFHVLSYIPITAIGGIYFARMGLSFRELNMAGRE